MLRIHVNAAAGTMSIPTNNPFAGSTTLRQEIFAYGLRNPFRDSFDRQTGDLFIGDVGQDTREEVDVLAHPTQMRIVVLGHQSDAQRALVARDELEIRKVG